MFQQHVLGLSSSRTHSQSNYTPRKLIKVKVSSGVENGSALKKNDDMPNQMENYKQREENYKRIIFAKNQEIAMMRSHIASLEENLQNCQQSKQINSQMSHLSEQVQLLLESYNQRILEIENIKQSNGQNHTELERQVLQLLRENSILMNNSLTLTHTQKDPSRKNSFQNISKIHTSESQWKAKFIQLNKEFHLNQEKLAMALAELDNYRQKSRSLSIESIETFLRY